MKSFVIGIADLKIKIEHIYDYIKSYCADYILYDDIYDFSVSVSQADIMSERENSKRECKLEGIKYPDYPEYILELTAVYRKIAENLPIYNAFVFHGSCVATDNNAYLFTAKSGVGKTTHTMLWLKNINGSIAVNGDKPIIRIKDGVPFVYGTPWSGKERMNTNTFAPLSAICGLERAKENSIKEIGFSDMLPMLIQQAYRPYDRTMLVNTINNIEKLKDMVRFYKLCCNMDDSAAYVAYKGMRNDERT